VVLEAGFNYLKVFSQGQLMQFVEQLTDLGLSQRNLESLKHWWPQQMEQFGVQ
jgi:hypothetical protein